MYGNLCLDGYGWLIISLTSSVQLNFPFQILFLLTVLLAYLTTALHVSE
jgi:hypothetical protein